MKTSRRTFLKSAAVAAASVSVLPQPAWTQATLPSLILDTPASTRQGDMLLRNFGRTGEKISVFGFGGAHIGRIADDEAIRLIRSSVDRGITFMDNCWDYANGEAERKMGLGLADGYRQKAFLMTKFDGRTKAAAAKQIDESLARLKTDRLDLLQLHEVIRDEDTQRFFATGGGVEAVRDALKAGKARHFGITGHKSPEFFLRFLEAAKANDLRVESVQMPLSPMDAHFRSFAQQIVPIAIRDQIGVLAMKTLGAATIPRSGVVTATECFHYALTLPTATVITGLESQERIDQAVAAAKSFNPLTREQVASLLNRTRESGSTGQYEAFKTGPGFDGTTRNPAWMG